MSDASKTWITVTSLSLVLSGCLLVGPDRDRRIVGVHAGASFGECLGYCVTELRIAADSTVFEAAGYSLSGFLPTLYDSTLTASAFWAHVASQASRVPVEALKEVYGCPDCADGGAEWVEFLFSDATSKRVTFEYRDPPRSLASLADTLRTVRETYRDAIE